MVLALRCLPRIRESMGLASLEAEYFALPLVRRVRNKKSRKCFNEFLTPFAAGLINGSRRA